MSGGDIVSWSCIYIISSILIALLRSSHPEVKVIVTRIKAQAMMYFQVIDMSVRTSQDGVNFAEDIDMLCDKLVLGSPEEVVMEFIKDMLQVAQRAHMQAEATSKRFRSVRSGLFEVILHSLLCRANLDHLDYIRLQH